MSKHKGMRRWQLETHLTLLGWIPATNTAGMYLLRNADEMVVYRGRGACEKQLGDPANGAYYLNNRWPLCEWADVPDVPLRQMAKHIEKATS